MSVGTLSPGLKLLLAAELEELGKLPPNWDGFGAPQINPAILESVRKLIDHLPDSVSSRPAVVPMSPGNLQLEWHAGQRVLELEFETPQTIHYLKWDAAKKLEEEDTFPVAEIDKAVELIRWFMNGE